MLKKYFKPLLIQVLIIAKLYKLLSNSEEGGGPGLGLSIKPATVQKGANVQLLKLNKKMTPILFEAVEIFPQ